MVTYLISVLLTTYLFGSVLGKLSFINQGYYMKTTNSFVVTCRIISSTKRPPAKCDFIIKLNQIDVDDIDLFTTEQWVLIQKNNTNKIEVNQFRKQSVNKINEFPSDFNNDNKCFTLFWSTHFDHSKNESQFRILMSHEFQETIMNRKCIFYPWTFIYPTFMNNRSDLSFSKNYIEVRFLPRVQPLTDSLAQILLKDGQWQYSSIEMSHIYKDETHKAKKNETPYFQPLNAVNTNELHKKPPLYYIVTDCTDGNYRWYVWKTSTAIQKIFAMNFKELREQYPTFRRPDHFAVIVSMLATDKLHSNMSNEELKQLTNSLLISDPLPIETSRKPKKAKWTADVPVWQRDQIKIKNQITLCRPFDDNSPDILVEYESFSVRKIQHISIKRKSPMLEPADSSNIINSHLHYRQASSTDFSSVSSDEDLESSFARYPATTYQSCNPYPIIFRIRGPDIALYEQLHVKLDSTGALFGVPKKIDKPSAFSPFHYGYVEEEFIQHITGTEQSKQQIMQSQSTQLDRATNRHVHYSANPATQIINTNYNQRTSITRPTTTSNNNSLSDDEQQETIYIVLYKGKDYGYEAKLISFSMFGIIFILVIIGISCIVIEQLKKRATTKFLLRGSISNSNSHHRTSFSTPPPRTRRKLYDS